MAALFRRQALVCECRRTFSTSASRSVNLQWQQNDSEVLAEVIPPYPYGPTLLYKQSRTGLYGGKKITYGNNVGTKIEVKTRRTFKPNIFTRRLFSKALDRTVQVRVSSRVLRTIDKLGGVDNYLLGEKEQRIKELGESGWWLRWAIMQTPSIKKRFAADRQRMGLPELSEALEEVEVEETLEEENSEALSTDDAFAVEAAPNKPRIKFRVGRGQHVYLTEQGWRRTRPDPIRWINAAKAKMEEKNYSQYMTKHMARFAEELKIADAKAPVNEKLTPEETSVMMKAARQRIRRRLDEQLELDYQRSQEARQLRRVAKGKERTAAERARRVQEAEPESEGRAKIGRYNYVLPADVAADIDAENAIGAAQV